MLCAIIGSHFSAATSENSRPDDELEPQAGGFIVVLSQDPSRRAQMLPFPYILMRKSGDIDVLTAQRHRAMLFSGFRENREGSHCCRTVKFPSRTIPAEFVKIPVRMRNTSYLLPATCLKTKILVEKRHHMVLEAIRNFTGMSARINFEAVRDSILVENVMQFAGIDA